MFFLMSKFCLSDAHYDRYDRYDRRKHNFPYRKLFTPDLNVFPYTKVIYLSVISVIYRKKRHSQVCYFRLVNDTLIQRKR